MKESPLPRISMRGSLAISLVAALPPFVNLQNPAGEEAPASRDAQKTIERYRDYLLKKPYHDWSFDKLVEAAVAQNRLKELVESYEQQIKDDPANRAAKIILARLYSKGDRTPDAIALLKAVTPAEPALAKLTGELYLKINDPKAAVAELDKATTKTEDVKFLQEVHRLRGKALLATGDRKAAATAFQAIADTDPTSFNTRLDVASTLSQHNLNDEAAAAFREAETLAGNDNSKRCRVLAELGRVQELQLKLDDALATYRQSLTLMGRGNWLKSDIQGRIIAIHKRTNTMEKLVAAAREEIQQKPQDADVREFLVRALEESTKPEEARAALAESVAAFPDDLRLSRRFINVLGKLKLREELIAEYQRVLSRHPEEVDFYLELGRVFAEDKRLEQARLQWEKLFQQKIKDPELCIRLAGLYAFYNMEREAAAMYEKAIELQPREIRHYAEYTSWLALHGKTQEVTATLEKAAALAQGNASMLEQVAQLLRENNNSARALELLKAAVEINAKDPRLLAALADAQFDNNLMDAASETLHRVINLAEDSGVRLAAVDRLLLAHRKGPNAEKFFAAERAAIASNTKDLAPWLILGKYYIQERKFSEAREVYEKLAAIDPSSEDAHRALARIGEDLGDFDISIQHYQSLVDRQPQSRRKYLKEMARVYLALRDQDKALELYEEILRTSPDNAAAFKEVAELYLKLNYYDKAAECLQQAIRLKPEDGSYHLSLAAVFRRQGEMEKAEGEILAAVRSKDEEVVSSARLKLYQFWSELGQLDEKTGYLRKQSDENPYDIDSPILLADIYIRELEQQLALEMLDKLLVYQPEEPRLLEARARILASLDRSEDSIHDYEKLLKLPKADRDTISLKIAGAALELNDPARASTALAGVRDPERVAQLYRKYEMYEPALAALEKAAAQSPNNPKSYVKMARMLRQAGDREKAVAMLERALAIAGDDWDILKLLATTFLEMGKRDECLQVARRLFFATRADANAKEEADENNNSGRRINNYDEWDVLTYRQQQTVQTIQAIAEFFVTNGFTDELADALLDEVKLQPRNVMLFQVAIQHLQQSKKAQMAIEVVELVRNATIDKNIIPKGYSRLEWESLVFQRWLSAHRVDVKASERRVYTIQENLTKAGAAVAEQDIIELAIFLDSLRKEPESKLALADACARFPKSVTLRAALASRHDRDKEYDKALELYQSAFALLPDANADAAEADRAAQAFRKARPGLLNQFPQNVRRRVTDEHLKKIFNINESRRLLSMDPTPGGRIPAPAVILAIARCNLKLNKKADALKSIEPLRASEEIAVVNALGEMFFDYDMLDEATAMFERVSALGRAIDSAPVLEHVEPAQMITNTSMQKLARILEKKGRALEAYDALRTFGDAKAAELLATTKNLFSQLEIEYTKKLETAQSARKAGGPAADTDPLRDAGVKLAEIYQFQKKFDKAAEVYKSLALELPDDFVVRGTLADLYIRNQQIDMGVAERREIIRRKRELNRQPAKDPRPKSLQIVPAPAYRENDQSDDWIWSNLRYSSTNHAGVARFSTTEDYASILRAYLNQKNLSAAAETLRDLAREDMASFRWMSWMLAEIVDNYNFGALGVPILKLLYGFEPDDYTIWTNYTKALISAGKYDEAQHILTIKSGRARGPWELETLASLQSMLDAKLGSGAKETVASLRESVSKDPKNIKLRIRLARNLISNNLYREAGDLALEIIKIAPHQEEALALASECLRLNGDFDGVAKLLQKEVAKGADNTKTLQAALDLANILYWKGDTEGAKKALLDGARRTPSLADEYTISNWFAEREMNDIALEQLDAAAKKVRANYYNNWTTRRLITMRLTEGEIARALDLAWRNVEQSPSLGDKQNAFESVASLLRDLPDFDSVRQKVEDAAKSVSGSRGELYRAAAAIASSDLAGAESHLAAATAQDSTLNYIFPLRISIARARGDYLQALNLVAEVEKLNLASAGSVVNTVSGGISEGDLLKSEKADLLLKLGRRDEALKVLRSIADPAKPDSGLVLARIFEQQGFIDEALELTRAWLDRSGEGNPWVLQQLASLYIKKKDYNPAIEALKKFKILVPDNNNNIDWQTGRAATDIFTVYALANRLPDHLTDIKNKLAADPEDTTALREAATVATFVGDNPTAIAALEKLALKPGVEDRVVKPLIQRYRIEGNITKAIETLEKMRAVSNSEWQRQSLSRSLSMLHLEMNNIDKWMEELKLSQENPGSPAALQDFSWRLYDSGHHAAAVEALEKARAADPGNPGIDQALCNNYHKIGKRREALDAAWRELENPRERGEILTLRLSILSAADAVGEDARVAADYDKNADDMTAARRRALLTLFRHDYKTSAEACARVLEKRADDALILHLMATAQDRLGNTIKAVDYYKKLLDVMARHPKQSWGPASTTEIAHIIGNLVLRAEGPEAAVRAWRDAVLRTPAVEELYHLSGSNYRNSHGPDSSLPGSYLLSFRYYKEAAAQLAREIVDNAGSSYLKILYIRALRALGDRARADELGWRIVLDPLGNLSSEISGPDEDDYYFSGRETPVNYFLVQCAVEDGTLDAFITKTEAEIAKTPGNRALKALRITALTVASRDEDLLKLSLDALAHSPLDLKLLNQCAEYYLKLNRAAEALPLAERAVAIARSGRSEREVYTSGIGGGNASTRFRFGGNARSGGGMYSSSRSGYDALQGGLRALAIIYNKLGRKEDAARAEREALLGTDYSSSRELAVSLAQDYAAAGLSADCWRVHDKHLKEWPDLSQRALTQFLTAFTKINNKEQYKYTQQRLVELLNTEIKKSPHSENLYARRGMLLAQLDPVANAAAATADARAALESPEFAPAGHSILGWIALRGAKDAAGAASAFAASDEASRLLGLETPADTLYGLGFSAFAAGKRDEGAKFLRRALAQDAGHPDAEEARSVLK